MGEDHTERVLTPIHDGDMDSLFILPLQILPIETARLRHARLLKNVRLQSVVEVFHDARTGSGQVAVADLPTFFGWTEEAAHPDMKLLTQMAPLPSYDVYSLRIQLRRAQIPIEAEALKLSEAKNRELTEYMTAFTRPLIRQVYGNTDMNLQDVDDLVGLFRDPDLKRAKRRLEFMAEMLKIELWEVPRFLEDYGDIFMSLSYYRQSLDRITPLLSDLLASFGELKQSWQIRNDRNMVRTLDMLEGTINHMTAAVTGRFEKFDRSSQDLWNNLSAQRFRQVRQMIEGYHTAIGGVLCGLTVKMNAWARTFPTPQAGGPMKRAEFIIGEMKQGIEHIRTIEEALWT